MKNLLAILHLEHDPYDAVVIRTTLEVACIPCVVTCVENHDDFVTALECGGIDLILSDISLPDFTGASPLEIVRTRWPDIPLIIVSGTVDEEMAIDLLQSGAADYVRKEHLVRLVPSVLHVIQEINERAERQRLETQFMEAQKMEVVGLLASGVAHDVNNILSVIVGYGDLLKQELGEEHSLSNYAEEIRQAADRASAVTRQLLLFSRKEAVQLVALDLNEAVSNNEKFLRRLVSEHIEICFMLGQKIGRIKGDIGYIGQVLMNLVINARDAMPHGGKIAITTKNVTFAGNEAPTNSGKMPGRYVRLTVADTGTGMTEEVKTRLFEAFFTTKPVGKGTGLGLAICQTIVKRCGGHITVESKLGCGTTFKVYFQRGDETLAGCAKFHENGSAAASTGILTRVVEEPVRQHQAK